MTDGSQRMQQLRIHPSVSDGPVEQAARWDNSGDAWTAVLGLCVLMVIVSVWLIWGDRGSVVGHWGFTIGNWISNTSIRTSPGYITSAYAIADENGYQFVSEWGPDLDAKWDELGGVGMFLSYPPRGRGWYGLTTWHRPLNFHLRGWEAGDGTLELSVETRKQLQLEMLNHLCAEEYPDADCPYWEIFFAGEVRMDDRAGGSYFDSYSLQHIRWSGYAHNLVTIVSIVLAPIAFRRMRLARRQYHLWKAVVARSICPVCKYDMRMLPEPRCPECGTYFRPTAP